MTSIFLNSYSYDVLLKFRKKIFLKKSKLSVFYNDVTKARICGISRTKWTMLPLDPIFFLKLFQVRFLKKKFKKVPKLYSNDIKVNYEKYFLKKNLE